jgi:hypothetical protein
MPRPHPKNSINDWLKYAAITYFFSLLAFRGRMHPPVMLAFAVGFTLLAAIKLREDRRNGLSIGSAIALMALSLAGVLILSGIIIAEKMLEMKA